MPSSIKALRSADAVKRKRSLTWLQQEEDNEENERKKRVVEKKWPWTDYIITRDTLFGPKTIAHNTEMRLIYNHDICCVFEIDANGRPSITSPLAPHLRFKTLHGLNANAFLYWVAENHYSHLDISPSTAFYAFEILIDKKLNHWLSAYHFIDTAAMEKTLSPEEAQYGRIREKRGATDEQVDEMTKDRVKMIENALESCSLDSVSEIRDDKTFHKDKIYVTYEFRDAKGNEMAKIGSSNHPITRNGTFLRANQSLAFIFRLPATLPSVRDRFAKTHFSVVRYESAIHNSPLSQCSIVRNDGYKSELFRASLVEALQHSIETLGREFPRHEIVQGPRFIQTHGFFCQFYLIER